MRRSIWKECKSKVLSYGRSSRSPEASGEVVHTDREEPFHADVTGMKYFQVSADEANGDKHVVEHKTRDAAPNSTGVHVDEMTGKRVAKECTSGDGAGEVERSVKFQHMLTIRGIKWRCSSS